MELQRHQAEIARRNEQRRRREQEQERDRQRQEKEREQEREQKRQEWERAEQEQRVKDREASLAANRVCPRCKVVRTDGHLWPDGHLYFTRYCENCTNATPHFIYKLTCPLLGLVRYVGITMQSLDRRLQGHMRNDSGTEYKGFCLLICSDYCVT